MNTSILMLVLGLAGPPSLPPLPGQSPVRKQTPPAQAPRSVEAQPAPPPAPSPPPPSPPSPSPPAQAPTAAAPPGAAVPPKTGGATRSSPVRPAPSLDAPARPPGPAPETGSFDAPASPYDTRFSAPARLGEVAPPSAPAPAPAPARVVPPPGTVSLGSRGGRALTLVSAKQLAVEEAAGTALVDAAIEAADPLPGDEPELSADGVPLETRVATRTATEAAPEPQLVFRGQKQPPRRSAAFVLGYRQFTIADRLGREQVWHLGSVEVTPLRRYVRLNLVTEVGFEGGEAARAGDQADFMLVEKLGFGAQYPHWVTPFVEFQVGAGLGRVELFERNDLAFVYSLGLDLGAQWAVTKWLFLHAAVGWVRPSLRVSSKTLFYDRVTFKLGLGF